MEAAGFTVDLVEPRTVRGLTLWAETSDLVLANGSEEERFGLRNIALRERSGDVLRFEADGVEFALRSVDNHPLDLVDFVLDARATARGNTVTSDRARRPWPPPGEPTRLDEDRRTTADAPRDGSGADAPEAIGRKRRSGRRPGDRRVRSKRRRRFIAIAVVAVAAAIGLGSVIGDTINELSGPGVGDSVDIGGSLVVRDVSGVGSELVTPFSAAGPWHLTWESLGVDDSPITITVISNSDRSEQVLVAGETLKSGTVGPIPSGSYRLSIESDASWNVVVRIAR